MKRCAACGAFFDAEECPNDHSFVEEYVPQPASRVGEMIVYEGYDEPCPALIVADTPDGFRLCVFGPGDPGHVKVVSQARSKT